jgi:eukaryotic-like serine/threonine-protein kinase
MTFLPDAVLDRLANDIDAPDLHATKYRLGPLLGRGGMGAVYSAYDTELEREVAVKVSLDDEEGALAARLRQEARVLAGLEHASIVPVHDVGALPDGRVFYVMKRVQGERLDARPREVGLLVRIFQRICEAIAFAHEHGIVHRDLKPSNVMVGAFGEVWVMDWGLAARAGTEGTGLGTLPFAAPEQVEGRVVDARADVFSLGVLLGSLLPSEAPKPLRSIVGRASAQSPADRYPSAAELAADVARFLDGERVHAHRETAAERAIRFARNNAVVLSLFAVYLLVRVLIAFAR